MNSITEFENMLNNCFGRTNVTETKIIQTKYDILAKWDIKNNENINTILLAIEDDGYIRLKLDGAHTTYDDIKKNIDKEENIIKKMQWEALQNWFELYSE